MANSTAISGNARRLRRLALGFALLASIIGLAAFTPQVWRVMRARTWPAVSGQITEQSVRRELVYVNVGKYSNNDVRENRLRITFQYNVAGQVHEASPIDPILGYVHASKAPQETFAIGKPVIVHANPDDPDEAFVDVSWPWSRIIELALSIVGLVWALRNIDEIQGASLRRPLPRETAPRTERNAT